MSLETDCVRVWSAILGRAVARRPLLWVLAQKTQEAVVCLRDRWGRAPLCLPTWGFAVARYTNAGRPCTPPGAVPFRTGGVPRRGEQVSDGPVNNREAL